ncbi:leucyl aminopeptidase [Lipingzhangella halophila]|uniref:Leucyl aminopeptidase n=1 Tax=Lipingzhangella halophila TaxID=1783352 RepID=A0A7W7RCF3_9ACTN|nr:phosphatase [Lipingzhangella halophila]MBB4929285.1 leucyl aminopeptidase [Lipingzhangella halophila]
MTPPSRAELVAHLVRTGIAGHVDTPRQSNLRHFRRLCHKDPYYQFGLTFGHDWSFTEVLALMAKRCGVVADEGHQWGVDTIDPDRTVDALESVADRMREAVNERERVMFATGHPRNLLETYQTWKAALEEHGCEVVTGGAGYSYEVMNEHPPYRRVLIWDNGVGLVRDVGGAPRHSHHPFAMRAALRDLAERGEEWPQLVIADHGFAGAAGEVGISTIGLADCNDPALFLAEYEGKQHATVPLDDGYFTADYQPLTEFVLHRAGLR